MPGRALGKGYECINKVSGERGRGGLGSLPHEVYFHGVCVRVKCLMVSSIYAGAQTLV